VNDTLNLNNFLPLLKTLESEFPAFITHVRKKGSTFLFDFPSRIERDDAMNYITQIKYPVCDEGTVSMSIQPPEDISEEKKIELVDYLQQQISRSLR